MPQHARLQTTVWDSGDPDLSNRMVLTTYFRKQTAVVLADIDVGALCTDVNAVWATFGLSGVNSVQTKGYLLEDDKPRPVRGQSAVATVTRNPSGPREVALCLSYYGDRNVKRKRGRLYIGPWGGSLGDRPATASMNAVLGLATSFSAIGGPDIDWVVYSPTDSAGGGIVVHKVEHAWVDNEWDTQRRRGFKANARVTRDVSG